jgi:hypothetical protein
MEEHVVFPRRFRGPPDSVNGGYACGVVAGLLNGLVEVTLRRPPPLDTRLTATRLSAELVEVHDGHGLVAEGRPSNGHMPILPPVGFQQSVEAAAGYRGFDPGATFASCFVCSPEREDGLRIFPGPVAGGLAAPWTPDPSLVDQAGYIRSEIVWAALDCPTFFASTDPGQLALLGRMTAALKHGLRGGEPHVVVAQRMGSEGRKRFGSSAIYAADGELCAVARAPWITIDYG